MVLILFISHRRLTSVTASSLAVRQMAGWDEIARRVSLSQCGTNMSKMIRCDLPLLEIMFSTKWGLSSWVSRPGQSDANLDPWKLDYVIRPRELETTFPFVRLDVFTVWDESFLWLVFWWRLLCECFPVTHQSTYFVIWRGYAVRKMEFGKLPPWPLCG